MVEERKYQRQRAELALRLEGGDRVAVPAG